MAHSFRTRQVTMAKRVSKPTGSGCRTRGYDGNHLPDAPRKGAFSILMTCEASL